MDKELRRNQNTLVMSGIGVIVFGVWSLIRFLMYILINARYLRAELGLESGTEYAVFYLVVALLLLADLGLRVYVGCAAIREGMKDKAGRVYVAIAVFLAASAAFSAYQDFLTFSEAYTDVADGYAATLADITSLVILVQLVISSLRLKRMRRNAARREA